MQFPATALQSSTCAHHDTSVRNKCFMSFSDISEHTIMNARQDNDNNMYSDWKTSEKSEASVQHSSAFIPTKLSGCKSVNQCDKSGVEPTANQ